MILGEDSFNYNWEKDLMMYRYSSKGRRRKQII
jgi:hypothetical protein